MQVELIQIDPALPTWRQEQLAMINAGRGYVRNGELGKWSLGDLAVRWCSKWDRDNSLIGFAQQCKMPFPRMIYEYADTSEIFEESARTYIYENCPNVTWSHCRSIARWCKANDKDKEDAMDKVIMANDNELSVRALDEKLKKDPDGSWITKRHRTDGTVESSSVDDKGIGRVTLIIPKDVVQYIKDLEQQRKFQPFFGATWEVERIDK